MMEEVEAIDYEAEVQRFHNNLTSNEKALQRFLNTYETDIIAMCKRLRAKTINTLEERKKVKQRIEEVREAIRQCEADHNHKREGVEQLKRELERFTITLQGKNEEVDRQKEVLAEYAEKIKKEERVAAEAKLRNQRKMSQAENSIQLFKTNLGLAITCMRNNRFILKFTQVSHSHPETEYMVEISLEEDNYSLLGSEPPLPSLPQLQEELNASGNLIACIVQIRKLFERMNSKRPRE